MTWPAAAIRLLSVAAAALGCGCAGTFQTTEVTRPLTVDLTLKSDREIEAMEKILSSKQAYDRELWLSKTRNALAFVSVFKYDDSMFQLRDLVDVLEKTPENAHAWVYMGIYLALQHQQPAAIAATEAGLRELDLRHAETAAHPAEVQLRNVALLNIALYCLSLERFQQSLSTLARIDNPAELDPFRRTAYFWLSAQAYSALRRIDEARAALAEAGRIAPDELQYNVPLIVRYNYPQYFDAGRRASTLYLEGMIALDSKNAALALKRFGEALQIEPQMWEARFARVNAATATNTDLARRYLTELLEELPDNGYFSRAALYFTFANLEFSGKRFDESERYYELAIRAADSRAKKYANAWRHLDVAKPASRPRQIIAQTIAPEQQGFPEAQNNLAFLYLDRMLRGHYPPEKKRELLKKSEALLRAALANPTYATPYIARANLAHVYAAAGRWNEFLADSAEAMRLNPQYLVTLRLLVFATEGSDLERASQAYALFLDGLLVLRGYPGVEEQFQAQLMQVTRDLSAPLGGPEQLRALARLYTLTGDGRARATLFANARSRFPDEPFTRLGEAQLALEKGDFAAAEALLDAALARALESKTAMAKVDERDIYYAYARLRLQRCEREPRTPCPRENIVADITRAQAITPGWMPIEVRRSLISMRAAR